MRLRGKLLALSLLTLMLPWSAWKLLQELEGFLRDAQEEALLGSAKTMASVIPVKFQAELLFLPETYLPLHALEREPLLDGYDDDWPAGDHGKRLESPADGLALRLVAGSHDGRLHLLVDVASEADARVRIRLAARDPRGLYRYTISPGAPGPLQLSSEGGGSGQVDGFWLDRPGAGDGAAYRVELALPLAARDAEIAVQAETVDGGDGRWPAAGTRGGAGRPDWIRLIPEWYEFSDWLAASTLEANRSWLVDPQGWVLADSGGNSGSEPPGTLQTTWLQRSLYGLVAGERPERLAEQWPARPVRIEAAVVKQALQGEEASHWAQDLETAVVWNTVAVPVVLEGKVRGAIVMQSTSEGLLLITNRALSRLMLTTLTLTLLLAVGLWFFATRLSRRVRRLSGAVSEAMDDHASPGSLPLVNDRDELGDLARDNEKLLRAVTDYGQYLQTLASKLSHELKTPLAITRSSLDNLASRDLEPETRRFVDRAREGVDRQTAIVRAMSEASRLEAAIGAAEWDTIDLGRLVQGCTEGYRVMYAGRRLDVRVPQAAIEMECAPDLLAQALDKLVDNAITLSGEEDLVTIVLEDRDGLVGLAVQNSGTKLPDELQDRLFDSLVSFREKRGEGTPHLGLGLYIVRLVAMAHGGSVNASNLPGDRGVEFALQLPRR